MTSPADAVRPRGSSYLPQLDGGRAIAVLGVVAFHARTSWFPGGYIGVDLFFVLSGFLITGILLRERETTGRLRLGRFYVRRLLRLFPALVLVSATVALAWTFVPGLDERKATLLGALTALTYTASPVAASGGDLGWMVHTWSLSVEEYFYFVWPAALLLLTRRGIARARTAFVVVLLVAVAYRFAAASWWHWDAVRVSYGPDTRAEQLLLGCTLAAFLPLWRGRVPAVAVWVALGLLGVFVLVPPDIGSRIYLDGGSTLVALLAALVVAHLVTDQDGFLSRQLSRSIPVWIGQRSYGIYLWNLPVVGLLHDVGGPPAVMVPLKLALSFAVPALSYRYVERPFLRLKSRFEPDGGAKREPDLRPSR